MDNISMPCAGAGNNWQAVNLLLLNAKTLKKAMPFL